MPHEVGRLELEEGVRQGADPMHRINSSNSDDWVLSGSADRDAMLHT